MEEIKRHFVDRILGRGIIRTQLSGNASASIDLEFYIPGRGWLDVQVDVPPDYVLSLAGTGSDLLYQTSRIAISQVRQLIREKALVGNRLELDLEARPWNGDLMETSYGGATIGYAAHEEARATRKMRRIAQLHYRRIKL
jgi:hypothetical protein